MVEEGTGQDEKRAEDKAETGKKQKATITLDDTATGTSCA